jgi:1-deoxy-D-xylulose-5-phosphate reductoisomerase
LPVATLDHVTPEQACMHPNWQMGKKISVDSATMMNKGLEYIEAKWLFNATPSQLEIILHPQSIIHSMVAFNDGSMLMHAGYPDMRVPIGNGLSYPDKVPTGVRTLNLHSMSALTFEEPDPLKYPCLGLSIDACGDGQAATTALNAANEIAVEYFLHGQIIFTDIFKVLEKVLEKHSFAKPETLLDITYIDTQARIFTRNILDSIIR